MGACIARKVMDFGLSDGQPVTPGGMIVTLLYLILSTGAYFLPAVGMALFHLMSYLSRTLILTLELSVFGDRVMDIRDNMADSKNDHGALRKQKRFRGIVLVVVIGLLVARTYQTKVHEQSSMAMEDHGIQVIGAAEFDKVIGQARDGTGACLWLFNGDSAADGLFMEEYKNVAGQIGSMVKVAAIDCKHWKAFCEKRDVHHTPAVVVYPSKSRPSIDYRGKMESKHIVNEVTKLIPDNTVQLGNKKVAERFLTRSPAKAKEILFSDKRTPPTIFKALSSDPLLLNSISFGFVQKDRAELIQKFKVNLFPTLLMLTDVREQYQGEIKFDDIRSWLSLRSGA